MEASKATVHHIKQVASDPKQPKSIWWDISTQTFHQARTRRNSLSSQDHPVTSGIQVNNKCHLTRRNLIQNKHIQVEIEVPSMEIPNMWKVSGVLPKTFSVKLVTHFTRLCYKKQVFLNQEHQKHISYKLNKCMHRKTPYTASQKIWSPGMSPFVYKWEYSMHKLVSRFLQHLILLQA